MATGKLHWVSPGNNFRVGPQPVQRALYERPALLPMGVLPKIRTSGSGEQAVAIIL